MNGKSKTEIAQALSMGRKTVRKCIDKEDLSLDVDMQIDEWGQTSMTKTGSWSGSRADTKTTEMVYACMFHEIIKVASGASPKHCRDSDICYYIDYS